jgi:putative component of toxin-antitoxin plasmid stabilization module
MLTISNVQVTIVDTMEVQEYLKEDGVSPYQEWFESLDSIAAAKMVVAKYRLELGNTSKVKWFDGIGEYKIDWNNETGKKK